MWTPRIAVLSVSATIALALTLSACGGSDDPSEADTVAGDGYELTLPDGWSRGNSTSGVAVQLVNGKGKEQTASVGIAHSPVSREDASLDALVKSLRRRLLAGVPELTPEDIAPGRRTSLDGEDARTYTVEATAEGVSAGIRGVVTVHDGVEYTVTFAGPPGNADGQITDFRSILESWKWAPDA